MRQLITAVVLVICVASMGIGTVSGAETGEAATNTTEIGTEAVIPYPPGSGGGGSGYGGEGPCNQLPMVPQC